MYIYKAAVVGAGAMGSEIAQTISYSGIPVIFKDLNEHLVQSGLKRIREIYEGRVQKGKMTTEEVESKIVLIRPTTSYADFKEIDIVIEAVFEDIGVKKNVFQELDRACPKSAILASNTSALSISQLGATTARPEKVIGMHFFYPAHVMKLVEIIPGLETSEETVTDVTSFAESLRKLPIRVNECAGFLVNRLLMPYLNEASYALQEGSTGLQEIDRAMVEFGFPMGPFTLVDTLGLEVCHSVVKTLLEEYGERMKPAEIWGHLQTAGRYGMKRGKGFYTYGEKIEVDEEMKSLLQNLSKKYPKQPFSVERMIFPMINEAALCLQEGIGRAGDIDLAMLTGIGFPPSKQGLLHFADQVGIDVIVRQLDVWSFQMGGRFWPAPLLRRMTKANRLGLKTKKGFFTYS
ncbi:MAG: hypothetical protein HY590_05915 [Candidatus Omnitrophica bacterium]|nr:hypothetical protein [Candidatus Omnitrophota bacterium]